MVAGVTTATRFEGFGTGGAAVSSPPGAEQPPGVVRAAPARLRERDPRPDAGAGGGDGRPARALRAGARRRSRSARSSGSIGTSASRPTSRLTRPTPPASSTTATPAAARDRTPRAPARDSTSRSRAGECFVAGGIWMPARAALDRIREAIADAPDDFEGLLGAPAFRRRFRKLDREALLKRMPRGYAETHPAAGWLRYRSFTATRDDDRARDREPEASGHPGPRLRGAGAAGTLAQRRHRLSSPGAAGAELGELRPCRCGTGASGNGHRCVGIAGRSARDDTYA